MSPSLEQEIRDLRSRFWSERDPQGRAFAPLADACRRAGDLDEAVELLSDGLGRHPEFVTGHVVAAWVHRDRGDLSASEAAFRSALDLDPENARALHGLGQLLARGGRVAAGRELVVRAVELDPLLEWEEGAAPGGKDGDEDPGAMPAFPALGSEAAPREEVDEAIEAAFEEPTTGDFDDELEPAEDRDAHLLDGADEDVDVVDIRTLAPEAVDGVLGDPDGRGAIVEIAALAPAAAAGHGEPSPELTDWSAPWSEPPADSPLDDDAHAPGDTPSPGATVESPDDGGDVVVDIRDLAPGPEGVADDAAVGTAGGEEAVAHTDVAAEPASVDDAAVAGEVEPVAEAPSAEEPLPAGEAEPAAEAEEPEELLYTRTMADLYARQGLYTQALEVVRHLRRRRPDDGDLATRQAELEARLDAEGDRTGRRDPAPTETVRRSSLAAAPALVDPTEPVTIDAAASGGDPAATADADAGGESIREYLKGLLAWPDRRQAPSDGDDEGRPA